MVPKTTKLMPLDVAMPGARTTLPGGLVVTLKEPEQIDTETIGRYMEICRVVCYGTKFGIWGFACMLNEVLLSPCQQLKWERTEKIYTTCSYQFSTHLTTENVVRKW